MKKSRIFLTIIMLALVILVFTGCQGVVPTPSPGATEDTEIIFGRIKMPLTCCVTEEGILEEGSSDEQCDETEDWPFIPNAMVELKSAAKGKCDKVIDTTYTDEKGNYRFENVKPGLYIINVYCPVRKSNMKELFFLKDVADKVSGQALDAGIPDCTSTALALVIEKINDCYNCEDDCFNTCTKIYQLVKEIADDVRKVDIDKILNHKKFGKYCDIPNKDLVDYVCGFLCCTSPGATGGGGGGGGDDPNPCEGNEPPVLTMPANASVNPGSTHTWNVTATDDDGIKDPLSFSLVSVSPAPASNFSVNATSGQISWSPTCEDIIDGDTTYTVTIEVDDGCDQVEGNFQVTLLAEQCLACSITVVKERDNSTGGKFSTPYPGSPWKFSFTGKSSFSLPDNSNNWQKDFENLECNKTYTIKETNTYDNNCNITVTGSSSYNINSTQCSVAIELKPGENVTVTFTNSKCYNESGNQHILITDSGLQEMVNAHPEGVLATMRLSSGSGNYPNSYFNVNLKTSSGAFTESSKHGWCLTKDYSINTGRDYQVILLPLSEYIHHKGAHMDIVCGILEQAQKGHDSNGNVGGSKVYTMTQVQNAIWIETNSFGGSSTEKKLHKAGKDHPVSGCGIVAIPVKTCGTTTSTNTNNKAGRMSIFAEEGIPVDKDSPLD